MTIISDDDVKAADAEDTTEPLTLVEAQRRLDEAVRSRTLDITADGRLEWVAEPEGGDDQSAI